MIKKLRPACIAAAVVAGLTFAAGARPAGAQSAAPTIVLAPSGLTSLQFAGTSLLSDGSLSVQKATLTGASGSRTDGSTTPTGTAVDSAGRKITQTYPWGTVACTYAVAGSRLNLTVAVSNHSPQTLQELTLQLLAVHFPNLPKGWVPNYVYVGSNTGDPTVVTADYGAGELAVCNEDVAGKPLLLGFPAEQIFPTVPW